MSEPLSAWLSRQQSRPGYADLAALSDFITSDASDEDVAQFVRGVLGNPNGIDIFLTELSHRRHQRSSVATPQAPAPRPRTPPAAARPRTPPLAPASSAGAVKDVAFVPNTGKARQTVEAEAAAAAAAEAAAADERNAASFPTLGRGVAALAAAGDVSALAGSKSIKVVAKKNKKAAVSAAAATAAPRTECGCFGHEHGMFANCTACGRVACVAEGAGSCFFCDSFVDTDFTVTNEDFSAAVSASADEARDERLRRHGRAAVAASAQAGDSRKAGKTAAVADDDHDDDGVEEAIPSDAGSLSAPLGAPAAARAVPVAPRPTGSAAAEAHRDKLLARAAASGGRPHVIDEQADFYDFEGNAWLSEAEKEARRVRAEAAEAIIAERKAARVLDLDLGGLGSGSTDSGSSAGLSLKRDDQAHFTDARGAAGAAARAVVDAVDEAEAAAAARAKREEEGGMRKGKGGELFPSLPGETASAPATTAAAPSQPGHQSARDVIVSRLLSNDTLHGRAKAVYDALRAAAASAKHAAPASSAAASVGVGKAPPTQAEVFARAAGLTAEPEAVGLGSGEGKRSLTAHVAASSALLSGGHRHGKRLQHDDLPTVTGEDGADTTAGVAREEEGDARARGCTDIWGDERQWEGENKGASIGPAVPPHKGGSAGDGGFAALDSTFLDATAAAADPDDDVYDGGKTAAKSRFNVPVSSLALAASLSAADASAAAAARALPSQGGRLDTSGASAPYNAAPGMLARLLLDGRADAAAVATDDGVCLSMHQPWASLLVQGIKRFEGRPWPSAYRGRLWIASTSRVPEPEEIAALEADYRAVYPKAVGKIPFPKSYPHAALLGCVDMVDCWSAAEYAEYAKQHSDWCVEPNESKNVFVCTHPRALPAPVRISGNHKLWNLPGALHKGLGEQLKPVADKWLRDALDLEALSKRRLFAPELEDLKKKGK